MISKQNLGFVINLNKIPLSRSLNNLIIKKKLKLENIISKGDDFQTLFTLSIAKRINLKISRIGTIDKNSNKKIFLKDNKVLKLLNNQGYCHKF